MRPPRSSSVLLVFASLSMAALGCRPSSTEDSGPAADASEGSSSGESPGDSTSEGDGDGDGSAGDGDGDGSAGDGDGDGEAGDGDGDGEPGDGDGDEEEGNSLRLELHPPVQATLTLGGEEHEFVDGELVLEGLEDSILASIEAPGFAPFVVCAEIGGNQTLTQHVELTALAPPVELADAAAPGSVSFAAIEVNIPEPDSFVDSQGEPVAGPIDFTLTQLDLLEDPGASPSCFRGQDLEDSEVLLRSFGMVDISAWTKQGEPLQLAEGKSAEISMPVPPLLAESTQQLQIPSWRLGVEEEEGLGWLQIGSGELTQAGENSRYIFSVDHFSWYNADIASNGDEFECYTIVARDHEGQLIELDFITVAFDQGFFVDGGWTSTISTENEEFNCAIAPLGSTPTLQSWPLPDLFVVLDQGTGEHGLCEEGGVPNPNCALVEIQLPDPWLLPNGESCLADDECQSGTCYDLPLCLGGPRCGECDEDADCPNGGCTAPNPFIPPGPGAGSVCNFGELGAGCETDVACNVGGSTCSTVFTSGVFEFRSCGTCANTMECAQGETCHPLFDIPNFTGSNSCVPVGSLSADSYCRPLPDTEGILACASNMCGEVATACGPIGICGECMVDANCALGETCAPGELGFPTPSGSVCE